MRKILKRIGLVLLVLIIVFVIDGLFVFLINRPLLSIEKDRHSYRGLLYDVYNCPELKSPKIVVKGTKFACADFSDNEDKASIFLRTEVKNVFIKIFNVTNTGATIIIKDENKNPYNYGSWYKLEKLDNDEWKEMDTIKDNYLFTDVAYLVDENKEIKFVMAWEDIYGKLTSGTYRLVKDVNNRHISVEFVIN